MMLDACPVCQAPPGSPCTVVGSAVLARASHVSRKEISPEHPKTVELPMIRPLPEPEPTETEVIAADSEAVWADLSPIQADAVRATAVLLLRNPAELAVELFPHLYFPKD